MSRKITKTKLKAKILFFDDEKAIAETLQKNVELFNFDVTLVSTISELFEKINKDDVYDLIIMDCMSPMPSSDEVKQFSSKELSNMDNGRRVGEILVEKIRSETKYANVPVLFYSAREYVKSYTKAKHIRKPELAKTIVGEINNLLNLK